MNALVPLQGRKDLFSALSGSSSPDNLFSDDIVELLLGVSEGPIQGLVNGCQSIYLNDTPLANSQGTPTIGNQLGVNVNGLGSTNFGQFDVELHLGYDPPDAIQSKLGGFGTTDNVSVLLDTNMPVVRTGTQQQIDFLSFRILFQSLYSINTSTGAQGRTSASFKLEYKPHSGVTWNSTYTTVNSTPGAVASTSTATMQAYTAAGNGGTQTANNYRETWIQPTQPTSVTVGAVWFNSSSAYTPKVLQADTTTWSAPTGLTYTTPAGGIPYYTWTETIGTVHAYIAPTNTSPPSGFTTNDLWVIVADTNNNNLPQSYIYNTTGWATNINWSYPGPSTPGVININGQTSGGYIAEYRIPVARIADYYDVRVTKLSGENTTSYVCNMTFDSFVELRNDPISFEGLAVLYASIRATDQFSQMPVITQDLEGRIIQVPTNYDPVARTYTGIWDGTWKLAYSNNTAYVAQDLITNTRYGLNAYYPATVDPDTVYAFGQHCDTHGFTYNELIAEARSISEAINVILGTAGGFYVEHGDGTGLILFDDDTDPVVALFTPDNVADGLFTYSRTDITARKNDFIVSYVDPDQNWITNRRRVTDTVSVAAYGRNTEDFVAAGCIDETEAYKRARLRLICATTENTIVDFKTNRSGLYLSPYEVIYVSDPTSGLGVTGRISSVVNSTTVHLRNAVTLQTGIVYTLTFQIPDGAGGYTLWQSPITTAAGTVTQLTAASALPTLPDFAAFTLTNTGDPLGNPKAFRITSIDEAEGDPDRVSISAIEINRSKWAYVDGTISLPSTVSTGTTTGNSISQVTDLTVTAQINTPGQQDLLIAWKPSVTPLIKQVNIYSAFNGSASSELAAVGNGQINYLYQNVPAGAYLFGVTAENINGFESLPAQIEFVVGGVVRTVTGPTNLSILNEGTSGTFNEQSPTFTWTASQDPHLYGYTISVLNVNTGATIRSVSLLASATSWTYAYADNTTDGAGTPSRSFNIALVAVDTQGNTSIPLGMSCNNPVPGPPTNVTATAINFSSGISWTLPVVKDVAGSRVYASTTNPPPLIAGNLVYTGPDMLINQPLASGVTMYYSVGCYDNFDGTLGATTTVSCTGQSAFVTLQQIDSTVQGLILNPSSLTPLQLTTVITNLNTAADSEEATLAASLVALKNTNNVSLSNAAAAANSIYQVQQQVTTTANALMSIQTTLTAQIGNNLAQLTNYEATQATTNSATSTKVDSLSSVTGYTSDAAEATDFLNAVLNGNVNRQQQINSATALAGISQLQQTTTSTTAALASLSTILSAQIGNNFATYQNFVATQATTDAAQTTALTSLTAIVNSNYTTFTNQVVQQATIDAAQTAATTALASTVDSNYATYQNQVTTQAATDAAQTALITSLTATVNSNYVTYQNQVTTQAATDAAQTAAITSLTATVNGNYSTYQNFVTTQGTENTSLANQITALTATVNGNYSTYSNQVATQTTINNTTAASITSLNSSYTTLNNNLGTTNTDVSNLTASVNDYQTTQATTNGTFAGQISTLQSGSNAGTANGNIQFATTSSDVTGVTAAYVLNVSVTMNGGGFQSAGMTIQAGTGFSQVVFDTASFIIQSGSNQHKMFSSNGDGTLTLNAVTNVTSTLKSSGVGGNGQPYMTQSFGSSPSIIIDDGT